MSYECEYCQIKLSTKSNLNYHQKHTISCLRIQQDMSKDITTLNQVSCEFCSKMYTAHNIKKHLQICKHKPGVELQILRELFDITIKEKDTQILILKDKLLEKDNEIAKKNQELVDKLLEKDNEIAKKNQELIDKDHESTILTMKTKLDIYKELSEKKQTSIEEIAKQPRITNNTNNLSVKNNYMQNLPKLCLEESTISDRIEQGFTLDDFNNGTKGVARVISEEVAIGEDNDGFIRAAVGCTDVSRKIFCYTTENGTNVTDIKATKLLGHTLPHIVSKAKKISGQQVSSGNNFSDIFIKQTEISNIENNPSELLDILAQQGVSNMNDYFETQAKRTKSRAE